MSAAFSKWVRGSVHECAPDESTQTVTVGVLRDAASALDALYEAAEAVEAWVDDLGGFADEGTSPAPVFKRLSAALAKARGEQVSA